MKKSHAPGPTLSSAETLSGIVYMAITLFVLPTALFWCNAQLDVPMSEAEINFLFYFLNFMVMLVLFRNFLGNSLTQTLRHPGQLCEAVILGLVAYYACTFCTTRLISLLAPGFSNYNDEAISAMSRGNSFLMLIGTVVLVPPFEECLYRGLVFRNLYGKNKWAAYIISIALFSMIHILGYLGQYSPLELLMACLQYLPAGLCLAWSYARADTIFAPMIVHAAINYITIRGLR